MLFNIFKEFEKHVHYLQVVCVYYFYVSLLFFFPFVLLMYLIITAKAKSGCSVTNRVVKRQTACPGTLNLLTEEGPGQSAVAEAVRRGIGLGAFPTSTIP